MALADSPDPDVWFKVVPIVTRLTGKKISLDGLKSLQPALKELRYAFKVFAPYRHIRKVSIFGSGQPLSSHPDYVQAESFAHIMRLRNWMVITGAGEGIMGAGQAGAGRAGSFGVAIRLPPEQNANEVILADPKLIDFKYFFTFEILFLKEASALCLFPDGSFAHDDGLEALAMIQTGKANLMPVVMIDAPGGTYWQEWRTYVKHDPRYNDMISEENMNLSMLTDDVDAAVEEITGFYRHYHSMRYVGPKLVLRLNSTLPAQTLEQLNKTYCGILTDGRIEQFAGPVEGENNEYPGMPRLTLQFNRKNLGTLRLMINDINRA
jgi:predicted Rossmann-fold nucleotide-binding protein